MSKINENQVRICVKLYRILMKAFLCVNSQVAPERCVGDPCMHGGTCRDFGSGLNCTCPEDYTGIGCQYEFDACEAGQCKNGATCIDKGQGYTCICQPG